MVTLTAMRQQCDTADLKAREGSWQNQLNICKSMRYVTATATSQDFCEASYFFKLGVSVRFPGLWHVAIRRQTEILEVSVLQAERRFYFRRTRDGRQGRNQPARKFMLRTKEDGLRGVTFHDLACVDQCNAMA